MRASGVSLNRVQFRFNCPSSSRADDGWHNNKAPPSVGTGGNGEHFKALKLSVWVFKCLIGPELTELWCESLTRIKNGFAAFAHPPFIMFYCYCASMCLSLSVSNYVAVACADIWDFLKLMCLQGSVSWVLFQALVFLWCESAYRDTNANLGTSKALIC